MSGRASRGAILVAALWSVALLAGLAMAASTTFRGFAALVALDRDRTSADALLTAGLEVAAGALARLGDVPLRGGETEIALPAGRVRIRLDDEGGRIDVGKAPPEVLASLFRHVGAPDPGEAAARVAEWRRNAQTSEDSEQHASRQEGVFTDVRQLAQVPGVSPALAAAVAPYVTVFGNPTVNPLTAPPEVVAALPEVDRARLVAFLKARDLPDRGSPDPARLSAMLGPARQYLEATRLRAVSVRLAATLDDGYARRVHAVIVAVPDDGEPYRILAWNPLPSGQP